MMTQAFAADCGLRYRRQVRKSGVLGMEIDIIFKIAAIGIAIAVLNQVLVKAGREEQAMLTTLAGVIVVLMLVIQMISEFFDTVRTFLEF